MVRSQRRLVLFMILFTGLTLGLIGCAGTSDSLPSSPKRVEQPSGLVYQGTEQTKNRLVGRFWSPFTKEFVAWPDIANHMPRGGWLMVGEQHDHPDHHQMETFLTYFLAGEGVLGHVIMEMVTADQQYAIDQANRTHRSLDTLQASDLNWPDKGWPWARYEQQIKAALRLSKGLKAGDLTAAQKDSVRATGGAIAHYSNEHTQYLAELIEASHCGMFSAEQAMPMVNMQIARDQVMAQQMVAYALPNKVGLLIAGSGHVRADYGAPLWLVDDVPVRTLLLVGVGASENPADYVQDTLNGQPAAQLVFFVPGIKQVDYCAQLGF